MKIEITDDHIRIITASKSVATMNGHESITRCFARGEYLHMEELLDEVEREVGRMIVRNRPNDCAKDLMA